MPTRTRIVATIGPASDAPETIDALLAAGMNVARVNCAHGTPERRAALIARLRERAAQHALPLAVLADLGGPKLRIGTLAGGSAQLLPGSAFTLTPEPIVGDASRVAVSHAALAADVRVGDPIYLNDGLIQLQVTGVGGADVQTRVEVGGWLSDHKGLSVPGSGLSLPSLTDKDLRDLDALTGQPPDFIGLSFVRSESDLELLREHLRARGLDAAVVAKIEKPQAVARMEDIVAAADAVMVARGDLGVECPIAEVPILQKRIIAACDAAAVPVITATQMLESMVANPRPTRAEASDVANAVLDGSDAVMLSAETATGQYPVHTVQTMRAIIAEAERYAESAGRPPMRGAQLAGPGAGIADAIGRSACLASESIGAAAIVCLTGSGATARAIARWRPRRPILAATPNPATWRRLSLVWGLEPRLVDAFGDDFDRACARILTELRTSRRFPSGATVVITAGLPFTQRGRTNTVRIETI
jgi:pyruvate kinase